MLNNNVIAHLAQDLQQQKAAAAQAYRQQRLPYVYFQQYDEAITQTLTLLWREFFQDQPLCLLAIGGFGRCEMYPFSDMDIAIVCAQELDEGLEEKIGLFIQTLWDFHLQPAPKVGTIAQLCDSARADLTGDSAFLESRYICGQAQLATELISQLDLQRDVAAFIEGKILEQQQRYIKTAGEVTLLEANVKTAPGGLRDIHTLLWLAKVQGLPPRLQLLMKQGLLTRNEVQLLLNCQITLAQIRIDLHLAANRAEDRLIFDLQNQVAVNMGYMDEPSSPASEKLMRDFYRATKGVKQLSGIFLPMLRDRVYAPLPRVIVELDENYYQVGNLLACKDERIFWREPSHIFTILHIAQAHNDVIGFYPQTLRAWWSAVHELVNEDFYRNPAHRASFLKFFKHGEGLTHLLRFMNLYGVLGCYLPEWNKIVGLLQNDLIHIYPVDDHILMVVRNMRRLALDQHSHELPFASTLMHDFPKKHILYLAALFHDIAKGRGGDHAIKGKIDAQRFAADHFLNAEDAELLIWLVQDHLLMSMTAQKEDINDPTVVKRFAERVKTPERLNALFLLTTADIRGTNPKIWNSWKASLLENVYKATLYQLLGQKNNPETIITDRQQLAIQALTKCNVEASKQRKLWHILGEAYFVRHEWIDILWHISKLINYEEQAQTHSQLLPDTNTLKVMIYMPNRPKLFAELASIFSHNGMNILAARAYITEHNFILDTFIVQFPDSCLKQDYLSIQSTLDLALNQFVNNQLSLSSQQPAILSRRSRHMPLAPRIDIYEEETTGWYSLDIIATNRRFLLANIAAVLSELNISIRFAKIATLDERVEDSFLVYAPELADTRQQLKLKNTLLDQIILQ